LAFTEEGKTMKRNYRRIGTALMICSALMLLLAGLMAVYNIREDRQAAQQSAEILQQLTQTVTATAEPETAEEVTETEEEEPSDNSSVPLYVSHPDMEMPTIDIDGNAYIGWLDIPALSLSLPVMSQWSYPNLKISPCRYTGSAYQNNLVIAAHNYQSHFGTIKNLTQGDEVRFTDVDGNVFYYQVSEIEQLSPIAVKAMEESDYPLTLFTCTIGGKYRVAVRCSLAE
jgi:sortase A